MAKEKAAKYPDADTEKTFKIEQEKREQPECFGTHNAKEPKCGRCWFHPDCIVNTKPGGKN